MRNIGFSVLLFLSLCGSARAETIALWNFNDAVSGTTGGTNEFLVDRGSGIMASDFNPLNIGNAAGSAVNSQEDPAGRALNLAGNANNGRNLTWSASTEGFDTVEISFAIQRTSTGFNDNEFLYSLDNGGTWIHFANFSPGLSFATQTFDLSGIAGLANNANAAFRIVFMGAASTTGNNKIDNLLVSGSPFVPPDTSEVPEPSTVALTAAGLLCLLAAGRKYANSAASPCLAEVSDDKDPDS